MGQPNSMSMSGMLNICLLLPSPRNLNYLTFNLRVTTAVDGNLISYFASSQKKNHASKLV
jgi:hypothetical protein